MVNDERHGTEQAAGSGTWGRGWAQGDDQFVIAHEIIGDVKRLPACGAVQRAQGLPVDDHEPFATDTIEFQANTFFDVKIRRAMKLSPEFDVPLVIAHHVAPGCRQPRGACRGPNDKRLASVASRVFAGGGTNRCEMPGAAQLNSMRTHSAWRFAAEGVWNRGLES